MACSSDPRALWQFLAHSRKSNGEILSDISSFQVSFWYKVLQSRNRLELQMRPVYLNRTATLHRQ